MQPRPRSQTLKLLLVATSVSGIVEYTTGEAHGACVRHSYCQALFPSPLTYPRPPPAHKLQHVTLVARHGDRTRINPGAEDGGGALTAKGQQQMRRLGETLWKIYLLSDPHTITLEATPYDRTIKSAKALLDGVFPSGVSLSINPLTLSHPLHERAAGACPRLAQIMHFTDNLFSIPTVELFRRADHQFVAACNDQGVDESGVSSGEDYCAPARDAFYLLRQELRPLAQVHSGPLLQQWIERVRQSRDRDHAPFHVVVAHDTTIADLMMSLDLDVVEWPPYAANLLIEVWKRGDEHDADHVRIIYNGQVVPITWCAHQKIHFADGCPWADFVHHINPIIAEEGQHYSGLCDT